MSAILDTPAAAEDAAARLARHVDPTKDSVCLAVRNGAGDDVVIVPMAAFRLLTKILGAMARGQRPAVITDPVEVGVAQAADMLNVSRDYVVKLLEGEKLSFRPAGSDLLIPHHELVAFKRVSDAECRRALEAMVALDQELGL